MLKQAAYPIPVGLREEHGEVFFRWLDAGTFLFDEPFFDQTISQLRIAAIESDTRYPETSADALDELTAGLNLTAPLVIIFHVSRCGSTLFSQLFSQDHSNNVLAEVPVFDQVLRLNWPREKKLDTLRKIFALYSRQRIPQHRQWIIKADSWHLFDASYYREIFPDTPFIFLYREPAAVLRSHRRQPGMQVVPQLVPPSVYGIETEITDYVSYPAQVMEKYYRQMLELCRAHKKSLAVSYDDGIVDSFPAVAKFLGYELTDAAWKRMKERSAFHSKKPGEKFSEDDSIDLVLPASLTEAWAELEAFRRSSQHSK